MKVVQYNQMADAVHDIIEDYFDGIETKSERMVRQVAEETVDELRNTSPKNTGDYAESWATKQTKRQKDNNEVVVYNKRGQLTHLLEHGHNIKRGGRVVGYAGAKPHIAKAENRAVRKLLNELKITIERG